MSKGRDDIEHAIALAAALTGTAGSGSKIPLCGSPEKSTAFRKIWTEYEKQFLRDNYRFMCEADIAKELGRTYAGVKLQIQRELHMPSVTRDPNCMTAEQVANGMGVDSKSIHRLMDRGLIPCRLLPLQNKVRVIDKILLMKWMSNPENFLYFHPERIGKMWRSHKRGLGQAYDYGYWEEASRVIAKSARDWKNEWLTPGQVVKILKIDPVATPRRKESDTIPGVRYINLAIRKGNLKARKWGNWWIKKSDIPGPGMTINFRGEIVPRKSVYKYSKWRKSYLRACKNKNDK